jgi:hypothetical protein
LEVSDIRHHLLAAAVFFLFLPLPFTRLAALWDDAIAEGATHGIFVLAESLEEMVACSRFGIS